MTLRSIRWLPAAFALTLCLFAPRTTRAEEGIVRYGVSPQSLQNDFFEGYADDGYRPVRLTGYRSGDHTRYFTRWIHNDDSRKWYAYYGLTGDEYHDKFVYFSDRGYHPTDVSGYATAAGVRFAVIWEKNTTGVAWKAYRNSTREGMQNLVDTIGQDGWVPRRVEAYASSGESRYISLWEYDPPARWKMHNKMTRAQYQNHLDTYASQGYALVHLDSHTVSGNVYYSGIWNKQSALPAVRSNRDWRKFQRYYNNYWASGYTIANFYATDTPDGIRYGGIWFYEGPRNVTSSSSLRLQVRNWVDGAPARGGAAIINLTTGQETMIHADQEFAIASTSKIGILYALLREIDLGNLSWATTINSGSQYGNNQANLVTKNTNYSAQQLAQFMISVSNNWAANRLIQKIGMGTINGHLADLGLETTRLYRYMTGTGGPSAHGLSSSNADHNKGWENLSTPREMVTLLKTVLTTNKLSLLSRTRFWATLNLDGNGGVNTKSYIASAVAPLFSPPIVVYNKPGSISSVRIHHADAGRMTFPGGQEVLFAVFMDEMSDNPDKPGVISAANTTAVDNAIMGVGTAVAKKYYP